MTELERDRRTCPLLPCDCADVVNNFAYGSNMSLDVLTGRRKITPITSTPAVLKDYALTFNLRGVPFLEPGFGNIQPHAGSAVHGVVHAMKRSDFVRLLRTEAGNGHSADGYIPKRVQVTSYDGKQIEAFALEIDSKSPLISAVNVLPSKRYVDLLIKGAKQFNMPAQYQQHLADIPTFSPTRRERLYAITLALLILLVLSPVILPRAIFTWIMDGGVIAMSQIYQPVHYVIWSLHQLTTFITGKHEGEYIIRPYHDKNQQEGENATDTSDGVVALD